MNIFKKHLCEDCGTKFRKIEQMMQHIQAVHGKGIIYECKSCNMKFEGMAHMREHVMKFHSYNKMKGK